MRAKRHDPLWFLSIVGALGLVTGCWTSDAHYYSDAGSAYVGTGGSGSGGTTACPAADPGHATIIKQPVAPSGILATLGSTCAANQSTFSAESGSTISGGMTVWNTNYASVTCANGTMNVVGYVGEAYGLNTWFQQNNPPPSNVVDASMFDGITVTLCANGGVDAGVGPTDQLTLGVESLTGDNLGLEMNTLLTGIPYNVPTPISVRWGSFTPVCGSLAAFDSSKIVNIYLRFDYNGYTYNIDMSLASIAFIPK